MNSFVICNRGYSPFFAITLILLGTMACKQQSEIPEDLVAQVNDEFLLISQLNYMVPEGIESELSLALKKNIISNWIDDEVLFQAALEEGLKLDSKEMFLLRKYEKSLLIQRYLNQRINRNYRISQKDIEDYYNDHSSEFIHNEDEMHIVHLLLEQRDNAIFREIRESNNLLEIIKKYYFDEKSTIGRPNGDLGYIPVANLPNQFGSVLKRMKTGAISGSIRTDQGYHFLQLKDRQAKGNRKVIELVKDEITFRLKKERREMELDRLVKDLKEKAQIQTYLSKVQG